MNVVLILSALIGSGGLLGAFVALRKVKPERDSILVTAAQGALVVQSGVLDELRTELLRAHSRIAALSASMDAEIVALRAELLEVTAERDRLRMDNANLRDRIARLERRIRELEEKGRASV